MAPRKKPTESAPLTTEKKAKPVRRPRKTPAAETAETAVAAATAVAQPRKAAAPRTPTGHSLVIVESPAKAKTIQKYLGAGFEVAASYGHIRDLPPKPRGSDIGINIEAGWVPTYVNLDDDRHKKVLADLKKLVGKADMVYLAPDPDREGEAIAWHLKEALKLDDDRILRVTFNEITKRAVQEAFEHPRQIDMDLVKAQEARRFLDRAVGYKLSPLLRSKVARGLSAGRVQSVAVRLVVEREREIEAFKTEEYWKITAHLGVEALADGATAALRIVKKTEEKPAEDEEEEGQNTLLKPTTGKTFLAELAEWQGEKFASGTEARSLEIATVLQTAAYKVGKVEQKDRSEKAPPPFTTSTLQQQSNIRCGLTAQQTMSAAQKLYEGIEMGSEGSIGLITYMRTDSTRVSEDALKTCRAHISQSYGAAYLPEKPNYFASGKSAQEAHEAIRPTDLSYTPQRVASFLTEPQRRVYDLIYRRFVASQMTPAIFAVTNVEVLADQGVFKAQGKILKFDGYRRVLAPRGKQEDATLPALHAEQPLTLNDLLASQHFTQPPPRYNEASLVKALEKEGIGRPSTYASIINKIQERKYVLQKERRFFATELGKVVTDQLIMHFTKIMDIKFTSAMEEELDQIEARKLDWKKVLDDFWLPFNEALTKAKQEMQAVKGVETGETCPRCQKHPLVIRYTTKVEDTRIIGCGGYPECKYIKPREGEAERPEPEVTDIPCPNCKKFMRKLVGKRGPFLGCSGYPECKTIMNLDAEGKPVLAAKPTQHTCNKCGKPMVVREGRRGPFLACTGYPKCKNAMDVDAQGNPVKPIDSGIKCEKCSSPMTVKRGPRGPFLGCSAYPKCRSTKPVPAEMKDQLKDLLPAPKPKQELPKVEINVPCPECGEAMELRRGRFGFFLGCTQYSKTKCNGKREVPPDIKEQLKEQVG